jgi:hypothetical protein
MEEGFLNMEIARDTLLLYQDVGSAYDLIL